MALAPGARKGALLGFAGATCITIILSFAAFDQRQRKTVEPKTKASLRRIDGAENVGRVHNSDVNT